MLLKLNCLAIALAVIINTVNCNYDPTWDSLDKRPLPQWYDEAKVGIFLHWGLFSVPSFGSEWFWAYWSGKSKDYVDFMTKNYKPSFGYQDFAPQFTAEFYDPDHWAEVFNASGAQYVVLTSKHHEGFTLWPSKVSWNWNAKDVGPKRDLLGDLATAVRKSTHIRFGVYHSMYEWFNPLYMLDKKNQFKTQYFVNSKTMPELLELVNVYKPEVIWSDGDWEAPDDYWKSTDFLAWLYNESPVKDTVVVNDRWGANTPCKHGGYFTCSDKYNPKVLQPHKWENAMTLDKGSWGFRRNVQLSDYLTMKELIQTVVETVSCGGNILVNIGPTHDGRIIPIFEERLRQLGQWLGINQDAIYSSKPWVYQNDTLTPGVWYTQNKNMVYGIATNWPKGNRLELGAIQLTKSSVVRLLGYTGTLSFQTEVDRTVITFPALTPDEASSNWAWTMSFEGATAVEKYEDDMDLNQLK